MIQVILKGESYLGLVVDFRSDFGVLHRHRILISIEQETISDSDVRYRQFILTNIRYL